MGIGNLAVDDFAQAIKDVLEGNQTAISHNEAREIVNKYFEELEAKMKDPKKIKKTGFAARLEAMQKQQEQMMKEKQNRK